MSDAPSGVFVCVVGPSGAGKDTLIALARETRGDDSGFLFVRRLVTRPANAFEDHDSIDEAAFARGLERGEFALAWRAHGLGYAVPAPVRSAVERGAVAVCNLSRGAIADARRAFPAVAVVLVTAPNEVIAQRLLARGRESAEAVAARIKREQAVADAVVPDYTIVNDGPPEAGAAALIRALEAIRAGRKQTSPAL